MCIVWEMHSERKVTIPKLLSRVKTKHKTVWIYKFSARKSFSQFSCLVTRCGGLIICVDVQLSRFKMLMWAGTLRCVLDLGKTLPLSTEGSYMYN